MFWRLDRSTPTARSRRPAGWAMAGILASTSTSAKGICAGPG